MKVFSAAYRMPLCLGTENEVRFGMASAGSVLSEAIVAYAVAGRGTGSFPLPLIAGTVPAGSSLRNYFMYSS